MMCPNELHEYINDTGFILVVLDSMSSPVLTKKSKHKIKELKNVEEHIFHPGGDSNHYCSMMTNMPRSYATYPLSQTSDRSKNRLAVFAVKLRESMEGVSVREGRLANFVLLRASLGYTPGGLHLHRDQGP